MDLELNAIDQKLNGLRSAQHCDVCSGTGQRQRLQRIDLLAGDSQWLSTRHDDRSARRRAKKLVDERGGRLDHVLAIVENQQKLA